MGMKTLPGPSIAWAASQQELLPEAGTDVVSLGGGHHRSRRRL